MSVAMGILVLGDGNALLSQPAPAVAVSRNDRDAGDLGCGREHTEKIRIESLGIGQVLHIPGDPQGLISYRLQTFSEAVLQRVDEGSRLVGPKQARGFGCLVQPEIKHQTDTQGQQRTGAEHRDRSDRNTIPFGHRVVEPLKVSNRR